MDNGIDYFLDSYALISIFERAENYEQYLDANNTTSYIQIYETYYALIRKGYSSQHIEDYFSFLQTISTDLSFSLIPAAVTFRQQHRTRKLSYANCIGYVAAKSLKCKFLTGDKEFETLPEVEFVK